MLGKRVQVNLLGQTVSQHTVSANELVGVRAILVKLVHFSQFNVKVLGTTMVVRILDESQTHLTVRKDCESSRRNTESYDDLLDPQCFERSDKRRVSFSFLS